ncbi:MAG TPA: hypothetical protein VEY67_03890 [Candidatus Dormibacteraeota bacterium]|nr:hypothetical protein [Candidatus Dormibacteraeota bacterium]
MNGLEPPMAPHQDEPAEAGKTGSVETGGDSGRPMVERVGLFLVALVLAALFGGIALALVAGGELFLGVMAAIGCGMTLWVGGLTLVRG